MKTLIHSFTMLLAVSIASACAPALTPAFQLPDTVTPAAATALPASPTARPTLAPTAQAQPGGEVLVTQLKQVLGTWQLADFNGVPYYIQFRPDGTFAGNYIQPSQPPFDLSGKDWFAGTIFHMQDTNEGRDRTCAGVTLSFTVRRGGQSSESSYLDFTPVDDACRVQEHGQTLSRASLYSQRHWLWVPQ